MAEIPVTEADFSVIHFDGQPRVVYPEGPVAKEDATGAKDPAYDREDLGDRVLYKPRDTSTTMHQCNLPALADIKSADHWIDRSSKMEWYFEKYPDGTFLHCVCGELYFVKSKYLSSVDIIQRWWKPVAWWNIKRRMEYEEAQAVSQ